MVRCSSCFDDLRSCCLVGDPAQIPAEVGRVVWDLSRENEKPDDTQGQYVRHRDDLPEARDFSSILDRLRDGECTRKDWERVRRACSKSSLSSREWKERFDESTNYVTYLFTTNKEVNEFNHQRINQLDNPIALIEAEHTGSGKSFTANK